MPTPPLHALPAVRLDPQPRGGEGEASHPSPGAPDPPPPPVHRTEPRVSTSAPRDPCRPSSERSAGNATLPPSPSGSCSQAPTPPHPCPLAQGSPVASGHPPTPPPTVPTPAIPGSDSFTVLRGPSARRTEHSSCVLTRLTLQTWARPAASKKPTTWPHFGPPSP